jgi:hypothetical protein
MIRPKGYCACCGLDIELYNDHLTPNGATWRCGNCFEGFTENQVERMAQIRKNIAEAEQALVDARTKILEGR